MLIITDNTVDKLYEFDTDTLTVTKTVNLPAGSKAWGVTDDATNYYVALNKASGGNSLILQVVKTDSTTSEIDTTASNTSSGTFEVDIAEGILFWSDRSGHVGTITLSTDAKTVSNTSQTSSNHFGIQVGGEWWWAGQGSAKVVRTSFPSSADSGGGSSDVLREHLKRPTFGKQHLVDNNGKQIVDYGFTWCGEKYEITDNWYTPFEKVVVKIGSVCSAQIKVYSDYKLNMVELALVSGVGQRHNAETAIDVYFDHYMNVTNIIVRQSDKIIDETFIDASYEKTE